MSRHTISLLCILFLAALLRFNNLMWGNGNFFHPDENNMARSISQMSLQDKLHPDFFAYGQLPLYLSFFSSVATNYINELIAYIHPDIEYGIQNTDAWQVSTPLAIFWLRFWSATASLASVYLLYKLARSLVSRKHALVAALLAACTPGLIQSAHFGTTESMLTFFFLLILYFCIKIVQNKSNIAHSSRLFVLLGITFGLAVGIKLTAVYFSIAIVLILLLQIIRIRAQKRRYTILHRLILVLLLGASTAIGYIMSSPYNLISFKEFRNTMDYEISVAQGLDVFYTRQFMDTTPMVFQITHVFPYALGWPLFVIGFISIMYALFMLITDVSQIRTAKKIETFILFMLLASFISFLIPNSIYYVKWTRFLTPIFPFFSLFTALMTSSLLPPIKNLITINYKILKPLILAGATFVIFICLIPGIWFSTIYAQKDTRTQASEWIYTHIPSGSYVLSETANVVDIPVTIETHIGEHLTTGKYDYTVISFNFYEISAQPGLREELINHLELADYIFVPSRRIFTNHLRFPEKYPLLNSYYNALFSGTLGFELIHIQQPEFRGILLHDEHAEETWTVFDHPVIRIYKKTTPKTRIEYGNILDY